MPQRNEIQILINAEDRASGVLNQITGNLQSVGEVALYAVTAGVAAATTAIVGFGAASLNTFSTFQTGMLEVFTLLPNITQDAMRSMESDVQAFMERTGRLSEETIPALYQALSAGVPQENVFTFLELANKAAIGGVTDLETAVDGITSVVNAYGEEALNATQASDLMFTAVRLGKTDFSQLSASLFQVVPTAAAAGIAFSDITAALATITAQGVPTSVATTQLRQAIVELNQSGTEANEIFTQAAGVTFSEFIAQGNSMADVMAIMEQASRDTGVPLQEMFGSVEAANAVLALTGTNLDTFTNNVTEMGNAAGATQGAFDTMNQGIGMAMNRLSARWESLMITIGRAIEPFVTPIVDAFSLLVALFADVLDSGSPMSDWFGELSGVLQPIGHMVIDLALWFRYVGETFSRFVAGVASGVPILESFQNFLYLVAGEDVARGFRALVDGISGFVNWIIAAAAPLIEWVTATVELQDVLLALGIAMVSVIVPAIAAVVVAIAPLVLTFGALVIGIATLRTAWEENWFGMRDTLADVWSTIQPYLQGIGDFFTGLWDALNTGGISGAATFIQDNLITPIVESLASVDWLGLAGGILTFLGNALITAIASAGTWAVDNLLTPLMDNTKAAIEGVDWAGVGAGIVNAIGAALVATFDFLTWIVNSIFNPTVENSGEAAAGVDWSAIGNAIMGAISGVIISTYNFLKWLIDTIFSPMIAGAGQAIAQTDWLSIGIGLMNAIGEAIPNIATWVQDNIITPIQNALASFDPMGMIMGTSGGARINPGAFNPDGSVIAPSGNFGVSAGVLRQFGGRMTAGIPTITGENGRELQIPDSNGTILNNRDTEMLLSGGGNGKVQIVMNIYGDVSDSQAREIAYKLKRELKAQGIQVEGN